MFNFFTLVISNSAHHHVEGVFHNICAVSTLYVALKCGKNVSAGNVINFTPLLF